MSGDGLHRAPAYHANSSRFSEPRVALVHYWLISMRGGERVIERLLSMYPRADIFTHVYDQKNVSEAIAKAKVTTTYINRLPAARRLYQYYLPFMPSALEELDLSGYDLVISSESGPAKGVITDPASLHVCYCHSPMRYLWDHYHQYRKAANPIARAAMPLVYNWLRQWDATSSARVDRFAANSRFVRQRIRKVWRRDADVVHPPVETSLFTPSLEIDDNYLWVGAMVPYKRPDLAVDAFNANGRPLLMVGQGSMLKSLKARANSNIKFVDRLNFNDLRRAYARARGFIMTAEEDFGIAPVEAMASGRPVVAFASGGAMETVVDSQTGVFFDRQDAESLQAAVERMEWFLPHFDPKAAIEQAGHFSTEVFDERMARFISAGNAEDRLWN